MCSNTARESVQNYSKLFRTASKQVLPRPRALKSRKTSRQIIHCILKLKRKCVCVCAYTVYIYTHLVHISIYIIYVYLRPPDPRRACKDVTINAPDKLTFPRNTKGLSPCENTQVVRVGHHGFKHEHCFRTQAQGFDCYSMDCHG